MDARAQEQITTLEEEVDDLEDQVDDLKGSMGTWQGLSAVTFVIGLLIGAAIVFFMKRRST
jgi:tetrahydromethanopterin S-methyltransferase subunit B